MAQWNSGEIVVKVMCLIRHEDKLLLSKGYDRVKDEYFYRFLGGSLDFGELLQDGVRREIREELQCEAEDLSFLEIIENIFTYEEKKGHQLVFLYRCDLSNKELYQREKIHIIEDTYELDAQWVPIADILEGNIPLYPKHDYSEILAAPN
jgi:ADP-ribose pyrophosphatase YjhB (NUDIX family)